MKCFIASSKLLLKSRESIFKKKKTTTKKKKKQGLSRDLECKKVQAFQVPFCKNVGKK